MSCFAPPNNLEHLFMRLARDDLITDEEMERLLVFAEDGIHRDGEEPYGIEISEQNSEGSIVSIDCDTYLGIRRIDHYLRSYQENQPAMFYFSLFGINLWEQRVRFDDAAQRRFETFFSSVSAYTDARSGAPDCGYFELDNNFPMSRLPAH